MKNIHKINENIYITSDEEIKEGDWFLDDNNSINQSYKLSHVQFANPKKIILTTDQDLIKDGVQAIDDDFLEWFVKNPSCERVELENMACSGYKIIIPKEEPKYTTSNLDNEKYKDYSVAKQRAANYMSLKGALDSQYVDFSNPNADKITSASTTTIKEEPKQETLEEVAKRIYGSDESKDVEYYAFILGAKWQQERMYSEEDMRLAIKKARDISDGKECFNAEDVSGCTEVCTYGWKFNMSEDLIIEQFKNK